MIKKSDNKPYYFTYTPIGGSYVNLLPVSDVNVKFAELVSDINNDKVYLNIFFNRPYSEMTDFFDEKYPYKGKYFQMSMNIEEAKRVRDDLNKHIERMEKENGNRN